MKRMTDYDYYNTNRNKIIGTNGVQYIGIPALTSGHMTGMIKTTEIALKTNANWKNKYINTIMLSYSKNVCDINIAIIKAFADKLGFLHFSLYRDMCINKRVILSLLFIRRFVRYISMGKFSASMACRIYISSYVLYGTWIYVQKVL